MKIVYFAHFFFFIVIITIVINIIVIRAEIIGGKKSSFELPSIAPWIAAIDLVVNKFVLLLFTWLDLPLYMRVHIPAQWQTNYDKYNSLHNDGKHDFFHCPKILNKIEIISHKNFSTNLFLEIFHAWIFEQK